MAFGQLYYTSCLTGLSGSAGFQFNAVSAGLRPELLHEVETLAAYQPPREVTVAGDAGVAGAPVNLCYVPGPETVIAQVVYVGSDYSNRPGNFFAHALVTADPAGDLGGVLPIELWGAGCWARVPVDEPELPRLAGPLEPGPVNRAAVSAFLSAGGRAAMLPALITAADDAVQTGRRRLVLETEDAASWVAALTYLLPPSTAMRMSFATYEHDPRYGRAHVAGTVAGSVSLDAADIYHFFYPAAGRLPELAPHPLAVILAGLDVTAAGRAWGRAARFAAGDERTLDDWLPVVAAAFSTWTDAPPRAGDDPAIVARWLAAHARRLSRADVAEIAGATLSRLTAGDRRAGPALTGLARAAEATDAPDLLARIEMRAVDHVAEAADPSPPDLRIRTDAGRRHATAVLSERLPRLAAPAGLLLLGWAVTADIPLDEDVVRQTGERIVGPSLLLGPSGPEARAALAAWPELRAGVVSYLDAVVLDEVDRLVAAFQGGLAEDLGSDLRRAGPGVHQALAVADVRAGRIDPVTGLRAVLGAADAAHRPPGDRVFALLFPDRGWKPTEAIRVFEVLGDRAVTIEPVLRRLADAVCEPPSVASWPDHVELCRRLSGPAVRPLLPEPARGLVETAADADRWADRLKRATRDRSKLLLELRHWVRDLNPDDRRRVEDVLLRRFADLRGSDRGDLIRTLDGLRHTYCRTVATELSGRNTDLAGVTAAMRTLRHLHELEPTRAVGLAAAELDAALRRAIGRQGKRWQTRLIEYAEFQSAPETAAFIRQWYQHSPPGMLDRLFRRGMPRSVPDAAGSERRAF
jgi:hypothetical protein